MLSVIFILRINIIFLFSVGKLEEPLLLDWHLEPSTNLEVDRIAALPGGGAAFSNKVGTGNQVLRLNNGSKIVKKLYKCDQCVEIGALLLLGQDLFVIHINGTVIQINLQNELILNIYTIKNVAKVIHTGCLYSDPTSIDKELLLLTDQDKGEVFSYRLSTDSKQILVRHLDKPSSVSYYFHYETIYFVVCDSGEKEIKVYDRDWRQVWSFQDHRFSTTGFPSAVVVSSEDTLIISVIGMNNISEFTIQGEFIRNLLSIAPDNIYKVKALSFYYPFFWVSSSRTFFNRSLPYRYKFVKNITSITVKNETNTM